MGKLSLLPQEVIVRETLAQHLRGKLNVVSRRLTLTNKRLLIRPIGFGALGALMGLLGGLAGVAMAGGKTEEFRLDELASVARSKFGLNDRILVFTTAKGQEYTVSVDDVESWIGKIRSTVNSSGSLQMVEAVPARRWTVRRRDG
ncbi:MAG: hypothetical protein HUU20_10830 [Pirellulales bacterium]|nr:hypothetical protein [Pirellulales bacterium]